MKLNKSKYFSVFFLTCFLSSFSIANIQNLNSKEYNSKIVQTKSCSLSPKERNNSSSFDSFLEETEDETEDFLNIQLFFLPYFISFFKDELYKTYPIFARPLAEKKSNPIYIVVCNFRI
ncbi:MAG: hypothetical protein ACK50L_06095 [Bacteroidota bacterium]